MRITFKHSFQKDLKKASGSLLLPKIRQLVRLVQNNPFQTPPPYEKLAGEEGVYSRRINEQHRLVYVVQNGQIAFTRCWGHYK